MLLLDGLRPRGVFPVDMVGLVRIVLDRPGEEIACEIAVFGKTDGTQIEDIERKLDVAGGSPPRQFALRLREQINVLLLEEDVRRVQETQILVEDLAGISGVHPAFRVMLLRQKLHDQIRDQPHFPVGRLQEDRSRRGCRAGCVILCGECRDKREDHGGRRGHEKKEFRTSPADKGFHNRSNSCCKDKMLGKRCKENRYPYKLPRFSENPIDICRFFLFFSFFWDFTCQKCFYAVYYFFV